VELAQVMVQVFSLVQNHFGIEGHVARQPIVRLDNTVWELSLNRADQLHKLMADAQLDPARIDHVSGHGDTRPNGLWRPTKGCWNGTGAPARGSRPWQAAIL